MTLALFGGSFDPPHLGHLLCAAWALGMGADEVWVLPVLRHPYGKQLSSWERRWELCRAAFAPFSRVVVRDDELTNPGGYTYDLVAAIARSQPGRRLLLVGGSDTARDLGNWHRGAELAKLVEVLAIPRRGFDDTPAALPAIASSRLRERLAAGDPCRDSLPTAVADLIASRGWYR